jgi:hypothetical protein
MANQVQARIAVMTITICIPAVCFEPKMPRKRYGLSLRRRLLIGDDVTVQHEAGTHEPDLFYQVKYHVDQRPTLLDTHRP